jgi:hypothetical protein
VKIEKLDRVVVYVESLEESKQLFSGLLGVEFDEIPMRDVQPMKMEPGPGAAALAGDAGQGAAPAPQKVAICRTGLELIEGALRPGEPPHVACFHFKVADYEAAKAEMEQKGVPHLVDITLGTLREAIYLPQGPDRPMMGLVSYEDDYVMDSIKTKG